jgi:hypothetical protein
MPKLGFHSAEFHPAMMRSPLKGLVLTFLLATSVSLVSAAEILFIVAGVRDEPPSPSVADLALASHVEDNGHTVTFFNSRDDEGLTREAADAVDVVYISDSVSSGQVGAELKDHPTPLIMGESFAFDDSIASGGDTTTFTLASPNPSVRELWIRIRLPR